MGKLIFFIERLYNPLKSLGKDVIVIFFSVLLAFSVDRMYENYQEKDKLQNALHNFYVETKQDITFRKDTRFYNIDSSIAIVNKYLKNDDISLMEIDERHGLFRLSLFSISLSYIEKNPNLVFDTEMQNQISKIISSSGELSFYADKMKDFRLTNAFIEKGVNSRNAKILLIKMMSELKRSLWHFERDFNEFEVALAKRGIK